MSVIVAGIEAQRHLPRPLRRLAIAGGALLLVLVAGTMFGWLIGGAPRASRDPFGSGLREAGPAASGLGLYLLALQAEFHRALTAALTAVKADGHAVWGLVGLGLAYGVVHAAGPGHGKAVLAGYLFANPRTLSRALVLSLAAALLQAVVAIALVGILALILHATAARIGATVNFVEAASFAAVMLVGAALLWRKTGALVGATHAGESSETHHEHGHVHRSQAQGNGAHEHDVHGGHTHEQAAHEHDGHHAHGHHDHGSQVAEHHHHDGKACGCGHVHMPDARSVERLSGFRDAAAVVVAAGIRPCSGAIILLVFALSQGLVVAGILGVVAMALGTAMTTGALAALAVFGRRLAGRLAAGRDGGERFLAGLEVLAAAVITVLGAVLLAGIWSGGGA